jgi:hypothetical protein
MGVWLAILGITAAILYLLTYNTRWNYWFKKAARNLRSGYQKGTGPTNPMLCGKVKDFTFRADLSRIKIRGSLSLALNVKIEYPQLRTRLEMNTNQSSLLHERIMNQEEILSPDWIKDDTALVWGGNIHEIRALLHPEVIKLIDRSIDMNVGGRLLLSTDKFEASLSAEWFRGTQKLIIGINSYIHLAELLTRSGSTLELLTANYRASSDRGLKALYFSSIIAVSVGGAKQEDIIQDALRSRDDRLMFLAIKALGSEGFSLIPSLLPEASEDYTIAIFNYAAQNSRLELAPYFRTVSLNAGWPVKSAFIRFLVAVNHPDAEQIIQTELQPVACPTSYRTDCARALGRIGTIASAPLLYRLRGIIPRDSLEEAIHAIRRRSGDAEEGQLSLSSIDSAEGNLSISDSDHPVSK